MVRSPDMRGLGVFSVFLAACGSAQGVEVATTRTPTGELSAATSAEVAASADPAGADVPRPDPPLVVADGPDAARVAADAPSFPGATVVDFEAAEIDGPLRGAFSGIDWDPDWYVYHTLTGDYEAHSGRLFVTNQSKPGSITFSFRRPVHFHGAWFSLDPTREARVRLRVLDARGKELTSSRDMMQELTPKFLAADAKSAKTVVVEFNVDFAMDDVTFTELSVAR